MADGCRQRHDRPGAADTLPPLMKSTVEPLERSEDNEGRTLVKLSVEVDEAEFDRDIDAAFRKIAREVKIPGFRPGKAPRRILEARIGVAPAREQALRDAIPQYLAQAVREHDVDIIATPEVDITAGQDDGPVVFDATVEVRPTIIVPGYAGLRVELPTIQVSDEEIDGPIEAEQRRHGDLVDVDRPAARGDYVTARPRRLPRGRRRRPASTPRTGSTSSARAGWRRTSTTTWSARRRATPWRSPRRRPAPRTPPTSPSP